jgi:hypothetical protein
VSKTILKSCSKCGKKPYLDFHTDTWFDSYAYCCSRGYMRLTGPERTEEEAKMAWNTSVKMTLEKRKMREPIIPEDLKESHDFYVSLIPYNRTAIVTGAELVCLIRRIGRVEHERDEARLECDRLGAEIKKLCEMGKNSKN